MADRWTAGVGCHAWGTPASVSHRCGGAGDAGDAPCRGRSLLGSSLLGDEDLPAAAAFGAAVAEGVVDSAALAVGGAGGEAGVGVDFGPGGAYVEGVAAAAERERGPGCVVTGLGLGGGPMVGLPLGPPAGVVGAGGIHEGAGEVSGNDVSARPQPQRRDLFSVLVSVRWPPVAVGGAAASPV